MMLKIKNITILITVLLLSLVVAGRYERGSAQVLILACRELYEKYHLHQDTYRQSYVLGNNEK